MAFISTPRCCLNALGSTSRSTKAAQLPRPHRSILPSPVARSISQQPPSSLSNGPTPKSSGPVVPSSPPPSNPSSPPATRQPQRQPWFDLKFNFSSITTPKTLSTLLELAESIPRPELALLSKNSQKRRRIAIRVLTEASKMDPEHRRAYFESVDALRRSSEVLKRSRKERAKGQIESGALDEEDASLVKGSQENLKTSTYSLPSPPASSPPSPTTSKPRPSRQRITFDFQSSSFQTPEALASALEARQSIPPSELALLTQDEQNQHNVALNILTKASKMDPTQRTAYVERLDIEYRPSHDVNQSQRAKAKKQVESGSWDEEDALSTEEWEEDRRVRREAKVETEGATKGRDRKKALKNLIASDRQRRRERLERLDVRREMKEAEEAEKGSK